MLRQENCESRPGGLEMMDGSTEEFWKMNAFPGQELRRSTGFLWEVTNHVECDVGRKVVRCTGTAVTVVTQQMLTRDDECNIFLKVARAGGKQVPLTFGIVDGETDGARQKFGDTEWPASFGAACIRKSGKILHGGTACGPAPGICDGDLVRLQVKRGGYVALFKGNTQIGTCMVGGKGEFRIAVAFQQEGQEVEILEQAPDRRQVEKASKQRLRRLSHRNVAGYLWKCQPTSRFVSVEKERNEVPVA